VAAWNEIPRYRGEAALSTWLCGIAVNRARQRIRTDARRTKRLTLLGAFEPAASTPPEGIDHRIDLERAIAGLPEGARTAVLLRHVHGLSYREVADAMSVSVGTAKSQASRGCSLLRKVLA
jgi:RNA polymerase sigma-70 factor (ECF subfamily)